MKLAFLLLVLLPAKYAAWSGDHTPFLCNGNIELSRIFQCDGKRQCPNCTAQYCFADDEDNDVCVSTQHLPPEDLVMTTESAENRSLLLSWSFKYSLMMDPDEELRSGSDDNENVYLAGYLLSGTSDHHNFKKTFTGEVNEYTISFLKPWELYEIILRPYYTHDGSVQPIYKVGKAAYAIYRSEAATPTAPAYVEVMSLEERTIVIKVGHPTEWNGEPGGYLVQWETADYPPERKGQVNFGIPETHSFDDNYIKFSLVLTPGRRYRLQTSALSYGHRNESFVGPKSVTTVEAPCTVPVSLTAHTIGPHDVVVTWSTESLVEYFEISACIGDCQAVSSESSSASNSSQTKNKVNNCHDLDEEDSLSNVNGTTTFLRPQDVLINVTGKYDDASVHSVTIRTLFAPSNVSVRVKSCCMNKCTPGVVTPIFTRPYYPPSFSVNNISKTAFEVTPAPSNYNQYQVRYCNEHSFCKALFTSGPVWIGNLTPATRYDIDVREGMKDANGYVFLGPAARKRVSTQSHDTCATNITTHPGEISSLGYPATYPNKLSCTWLLKDLSGGTIILVFKDFELEKDDKCASDHVTVYDGQDSDAPMLGRFCGNIVPLPLMSSSSQLYVVFESDGQLGGRGFRATHSLTNTRPVVATRDSEKIIYSHTTYGRQPYDNKVNHDWLIQAKGGRVHLRFSAFELENDDSCGYDFVKIFDGNDDSAPLLKTFCGNQIPDGITSSSGFLLLRFHTDESNVYEGFAAFYSMVE